LAHTYDGSTSAVPRDDDAWIGTYRYDGDPRDGAYSVWRDGSRVEYSNYWASDYLDTADWLEDYAYIGQYGVWNSGHIQDWRRPICEISKDLIEENGPYN
jgi:hypothetical protein